MRTYFHQCSCDRCLLERHLREERDDDEEEGRGSTKIFQQVWRSQVTKERWTLSYFRLLLVDRYEKANVLSSVFRGLGSWNTFHRALKSTNLLLACRIILRIEY